LQAVVAKVTGQPFDVFIQENILRPFGMTSSRISWDLPFARRIAKPHDSSRKRISGKYEALPSTEARNHDLERYGAAASLLTTPTDYAKFVLEIINPKPADRYRLNADTGGNCCVRR
jgi:CubicO group peptidase (beta-lactamase class C family)